MNTQIQTTFGTTSGTYVVHLEIDHVIAICRRGRGAFALTGHQRRLAGVRVYFGAYWCERLCILLYLGGEVGFVCAKSCQTHTSVWMSYTVERAAARTRKDELLKFAFRVVNG